ncbi:hypothetical protein RhiJN_04209 [Ceratobasidium sp. AG-Ba]|nr:hypothetical protein RhiJN_04209 [Ceratobasidium sp. AG-Ba]QRW05099.1 hypothetical protein RhiLY_04098 [Ceratobasidium sp. AG-Ba]
MVSEKSPANKISVNAAEQDDQIDSVTVFQAHHAEVKRRVQLELKQGQNHVTIERLPSCIREESIRVDGVGAAVIFDVLYHRPVPASTLNDGTVAETRRVLDALRKERDVARDQSNFLNAYGKTLDSKSIGIEDMQRFLDMFGPRQVAIAKQIQELDIRVDEAEKAYNQARSKVYEDAQGAKRGTRITVTVLSEIDGNAELLLTYVVSNASWTPLYDVRATIAKSSDELSMVKLHYRASITQTTGEDWPEVALTLSTASPQLGAEVPKLSSWRVGFPFSGTINKIEAPAEEKEESDDDMGFGLFDDGPSIPAPQIIRVESSPPLMAFRETRVTSQGVLSATFGISGRSNIPSDQGSHKVVIAVLDYKAELEWVCIPRQKENVFLKCKVVNASEFTLLPGDASVFVDDNFVSKSRIEHVSPNDSFETSLGIDSALRVSYPPIRTLKRTTARSGFAFLGKDTRQTITTNSQRITARNTRPSNVSLRILDHVPVSTDELLKVSVLVPDGLGAMTEEKPEGDRSEEDQKRERTWVTVFKGTKARWANLDIGGEGTVEWLCEIGPSKEIEIELEWEISAPIGKTWRDA